MQARLREARWRRSATPLPLPPPLPLPSAEAAAAAVGFCCMAPAEEAPPAVVVVHLGVVHWVVAVWPWALPAPSVEVYEAEEALHLWPWLTQRTSLARTSSARLFLVTPGPTLARAWSDPTEPRPTRPPPLPPDLLRPTKGFGPPCPARLGAPGSVSLNSRASGDPSLVALPPSLLVQRSEFCTRIFHLFHPGACRERASSPCASRPGAAVAPPPVRGQGGGELEFGLAEPPAGSEARDRGCAFAEPCAQVPRPAPPDRPARPRSSPALCARPGDPPRPAQPALEPRPSPRPGIRVGSESDVREAREPRTSQHASTSRGSRC